MCVCAVMEGGAGLFDAALSATRAALGPLIGVLLDCIVNMAHYRLYILRIIYQTLSHDRPAHCGVQSTIKMKKGPTAREQKAIPPKPKLRRDARHKSFSRRCPETRHAWCTLSFDFHPELSIKIIQRLHFITWARGNLSAIKPPLVSVEKFSRWTSGLEEAEHEMKCTWLPALPFVQTWPGTLEQMCRYRLQQTGQGCAWNRESAVTLCLSDRRGNRSTGFLGFRIIKINNLLFFALDFNLF